MDYQILTRTPLFDIMQGVQSEMEIETAYRGFVDEVFSLLASSVDSRNLLVMLQFTELELQCRRQRIADPACLEYCQKVQDFIGRMMQCLTTQVFPLPTTSETPHEANPSIRWTGLPWNWWSYSTLSMSYIASMKAKSRSRYWHRIFPPFSG